jgi:hypothetical protein
VEALGVMAVVATLARATTSLGELRTNNYWQALLDAAIVQPLRACFDGVQILLDDTAGQAGTAVGTWLRRNLHP